MLATPRTSQPGQVITRSKLILEADNQRRNSKKKAVNMHHGIELQLIYFYFTLRLNFPGFLIKNLSFALLECIRFGGKGYILFTSHKFLRNSENEPRHITDNTYAHSATWDSFSIGAFFAFWWWAEEEKFRTEWFHCNMWEPVLELT